MIELQLPVLTFAGVLGAVYVLGLVVWERIFRYRSDVGRRLSAEFGAAQSQSVEQIKLFKDLGKLARQTESEAEGPEHTLERLIEQAGLTLSVQQLLTMCVVCGLVAGGVVGVALQLWWAAAIGIVLALPVPILFVAVRRERRLNRLRLQLPDAFEMMSRTIRAGQTVARAFQTVADDFEAPIADEFAWCSEQQNLGLPQEVALRDLGRRTGISELQMLVVALLVQRQSGGSPVEMLDNLAKVVRRRIEVQEKIKTLTAEGRMQAAVLLLLPPLLLAIISLLNPDYVSKLWDRPMLLAGMLASELIGVAWIRGILKLEY
jgi:tight adherence protein B